MIINTGTVILTLILCAFFLYGGLQLVRKFALQIAQENHDAVTAMDNAAENKRLKREREADEAAAAAFAKVKPMLNTAAVMQQAPHSSSSRSPRSPSSNTASV